VCRPRAELHVRFANSQGFFPPYTSQLTGGSYSSNHCLSLRQGASNTRFSPGRENWATADATDLIIPTMLKQLMKGANSDSLAAAHTQLSNVLNKAARLPC